MQITTFVVTGLHGYMSRSLAFSEGLNLIVGINGSGKTSLLNLMNDLLQPNIAKLATTKFSKATLSFILKNKHFKIIASQTTKILKIEVVGDATITHPLKIILRHKSEICSIKRVGGKTSLITMEH